MIMKINNRCLSSLVLNNILSKESSISCIMNRNTNLVFELGGVLSIVVSTNIDLNNQIVLGEFLAV